MKSFKEFCKLVEGYYEPNQPLPSGKTPRGKATSSYWRQKGEYLRNLKSKPKPDTGLVPRPVTLRSIPYDAHTKTSSDRNATGPRFDRLMKQLERSYNQVRRGADNPNLDFKRGSGKYNIYGRGDFMAIEDPKSGVEMSVKQKQKVYFDKSNKTRTGKIPRPIYDIEWYNNKRSGQMQNPGKARSVVRSVADMWKSQVEPRLPRNSVITNFPVSNDTSDRNSRANLYSKVANFGPRDEYTGRQYAKVGNNPSSKQSAKGASRIKPLTPESGDISGYRTSDEMDRFNKIREPKFKESGNSTATQKAPRKISPAKPSRPSINREIKNLANKPSLKAPSVPKIKVKPKSRRGGGGMFGSFPTIGTPSNRGSFPTTLGGVLRRTSGPISPGDMMRRGGV